MFSAYKLSRNKYSGNIYEAVFEKAKDRGGTGNRTSVYARESRMVLLKRCYEKFCRIHKKTFESLFWCFLVNFAKFVRTSFLSNNTGLLLLIIAVSIVTKGVLANETVNYDTKTKAYVITCVRSKSYEKEQPR